MTTIHNAYVIPRNESEWSRCDPEGNYISFRKANPELELCLGYEDDELCLFVLPMSEPYKQVTIKQWVDLKHDRIAGWRLEEIGWNRNVTHFKKEGDTEVTDIVWYNLFIKCQSGHHELIFHDGVVRLVNDKLNIKTFTEVLQFVNFLTYPSVS